MVYLEIIFNQRFIGLISLCFKMRNISYRHPLAARQTNVLRLNKMNNILRKIIRYTKAFLLMYGFVFIMMTLSGKLSSFRYKDPIPMDWDELFTNHLNTILLIPLFFGVMTLYITYDYDKDKKPKLPKVKKYKRL